MPLSAHINGYLWAVSSEGAVFYTPSNTPAWQCLPLAAMTTTLAACESLDTVFLACDDGTLYAVRASTGQMLRQSATPLHSRPQCLAVVANEQALFAGLTDGAVVRIHLPSLAFDCMLGCGVEHSSAVRALAVDNHYLYSAGDDAVVLVWDLKDLTTVRDFSVSTVPIRSLLRVDFVLWLGLQNGSVQVIEIFGDDLNGVTNVSAKRPHNSPVVDLIQIGQTQVWSLEEQPTVASPSGGQSSDPANQAETPPNRSNVAVWDIHDFTYQMSDDVDDLFVKSLAVVRSEPFHRVTIAALSPDLSAQLVVSDVPATRNPSIPLNPSPDTHPQPYPDSQPAADEQQQGIYVKDLERQLAEATEKLRLIDADAGSAALANNNLQMSGQDFGMFNNNQPINNERDLTDSPIHPSSSQTQFSPVEEINVSNPTPIVDGPHVNNAFASTSSTAIPVPVPVPVTVPITADPFVMPASVTDAIQTSLSKLADVLGSLLTEDVLSYDSGTRIQQSSSTAASIGTPVRRRKSATNISSGSTVLSTHQHQHKEYVRNTVAMLTKELNIARQLVASCASGDDITGRGAQLLKKMKDPSNLILTPSPSSHDIKQLSTSSSAGTAAQLLSDQDTIRDLKRRIDELIGRAERAESDSRNIRNERDLLRDEVNHEREQAEQTLSSMEAMLRERTTTIDERNKEIKELRDACDKVEQKLKEERQARRGLEEKKDELKRGNRKLADRCKSVEAELEEATVAVESARKDLASREDCLRKHYAKKECEFDVLQNTLQDTQREFDLFRKRANHSLEDMRTRLRLHEQTQDTTLPPQQPGLGLPSVPIHSLDQPHDPEKVAEESGLALSPQQANFAPSAAVSDLNNTEVGHSPNNDTAIGIDMNMRNNTSNDVTTPGTNEIAINSDNKSESVNNENVCINEEKDEVSSLRKQLEEARIRIAELETEKKEKVSETCVIESQESDGKSESTARSVAGSESEQRSNKINSAAPAKKSSEKSSVQGQSPRGRRKSSSVRSFPPSSSASTSASSLSSARSMRSPSSVRSSASRLSRGGRNTKSSNSRPGTPRKTTVAVGGGSPAAARATSSREDAKNERNLEILQHECEELRNRLAVQVSVIEDLKQTVNKFNADRKDAGEKVRRESSSLKDDGESEGRKSLDESELRTLRDEVDLLKCEVEHRQTAASLYEEEAENMKCVIGDLREATNELQASLERSDEETRQLYTRLEELRATLRVRDMRIAQLEGRLAALSCCRDINGNDIVMALEEVDQNDINNDNQDVIVTSPATVEGSVDEGLKTKALEALLASANGEIDQMSREIEALYRRQVAQDKELQSAYEGSQIRDERIRERDTLIESLKRKIQQQRHANRNDVNEWLSRASIGNASAQIDTAIRNGNDNGPLQQRLSSRHMSGGELLSPTSSPSSSSPSASEDVVKATLRELEEGVIVTQQRMRDVLRLAREYKSLAQSHVSMLPVLYEIERHLARLSTTVSPSNERTRESDSPGQKVGESLSTVRGIMQSIIAQFYSHQQKRAHLGDAVANNDRYQPCDQRKNLLVKTLARLRESRTRISS